VTRESAYDKASRLLAEGRVIVLEANKYGFAASVRGEGHVYCTRWTWGQWQCTCEARRPTCSHIAACRRISAIDLPRRTR
jgi:hypothetical protein